MGTVFVTAALALPFWLGMARHRGKENAYQTGAGLLVVTLLGFFVLPARAGYLALLLCFCAGIGISAIHVLSWSIIPDVAEYDEMNGGQRREGF